MQRFIAQKTMPMYQIIEQTSLAKSFRKLKILLNNKPNHLTKIRHKEIHKIAKYQLSIIISEQHLTFQEFYLNSHRFILQFLSSTQHMWLSQRLQSSGYSTQTSVYCRSMIMSRKNMNLTLTSWTVRMTISINRS